MVHRIRNAKRSFYRNSINNNLENPKNFWRIIRSVAPSKCNKLPNHLTIDGKSYHDYHDIAILFNEHFANSSSSVQLSDVSEPPNWNRIAGYVRSTVQSGVSHCIPLVTEDFFGTSLQQLSTGKASGLDDLSSCFLKTAVLSISSSLTAIFNLSFFLVFFLTFGKLQRSRHFIRMVRCLTVVIIAPYQFCLRCL